MSYYTPQVKLSPVPGFCEIENWCYNLNEKKYSSITSQCTVTSDCLTRVFKIARYKEYTIYKVENSEKWDYDIQHRDRSIA